MEARVEALGRRSIEGVEGAAGISEGALDDRVVLLLELEDDLEAGSERGI